MITGKALDHQRAGGGQLRPAVAVPGTKPGSTWSL
ncbi:MAG: hypothetical protein QOD96_7367, partial [Pseudonocardiales bacterium]|nr:hypothetical protein [Pseudonocardiales bacterium]